MDTTQQQVQLGMELLDQEYPKWREALDLSLLDMGSSSNGLLEQLYDSYAHGLQKLSLCSHEGYEYGFDIRYEGSDEENIRQWQSLTQMWKDALSKGDNKK